MRFRNITWQLTALIVAAAPIAASADVVTPGAYSDLLLWYRGDDLTATTAAGGSVSTWADASTSGNDALDPGGTFNTPTFDISDLPVVSFAADTKDGLAAADANDDATPGDVTIITVYKTSNVTDSETRPMGFGGRAFDGASFQQNINLADDPSLRFDGAAIASYGTSITAGEFFTRSVTRSGDQFTDYFNGTQVKNASQSLGAVVDEFYLGDVHTDGTPGGGGAADHQVAEVIVYNRALTTDERQSIENYLSAKYYSNAYYRFEEGSSGAALGSVGGALDHTVNANNATGSGGPTFSSQTANARVPLTRSANNLSLDFERSSGQYLSVAHGDDVSFGDSSFTIEAYVKFESPPGAGAPSRQYLVWKKASSGVSDTQVDYGIVFAENTGYGASAAGELVFVQGDGSSLNNVPSGLILTDTTDWHYVAVAFDAVNDLVRFTLDDQVVTKTNTFAAAENMVDLIIGGHFSGSGALNSFDGLIDELRITGSYLTEDQLLNAIPTPAALPAGLALLGLISLRRRH